MATAELTIPHLRTDQYQGQIHVGNYRVFNILMAIMSTVVYSTLHHNEMDIPFAITTLVHREHPS